jgi:hypothetical protein
LSMQCPQDKTLKALAADVDRLVRQLRELQELREAVVEAERIRMDRERRQALGQYLKIFQVLAPLRRSHEPARLLSATSPRLRRSNRIAKFRKHGRVRTLGWRFGSRVGL